MAHCQVRQVRLPAADPRQIEQRKLALTSPWRKAHAEDLQFSALQPLHVIGHLQQLRPSRHIELPLIIAVDLHVLAERIEVMRGIEQQGLFVQVHAAEGLRLRVGQQADQRITHFLAHAMAAQDLIVLEHPPGLAVRVNHLGLLVALDGTEQVHRINERRHIPVPLAYRDEFVRQLPVIQAASFSALS